MYSLSETTAKKATRKTSQEFLDFNEEHLSRIYPCASRINSSNYNPGYYWMRGCQMVALNYQTNGNPLHIAKHARCNNNASTCFKSN